MTEQKWGFLQRAEIGHPSHPGVVYLRRYILVMCPWFQVYLHHILRPDFDRHLHNHPWAGVSLILHGGYAELVTAPGDEHYLVRHGIGALNVLRRDTYHRITQVKRHTWTLLVAGRRKSSWGFWVSDRGHVDYETYLAELRAGGVRATDNMG
jgi:hypothetical protein